MFLSDSETLAESASVAGCLLPTQTHHITTVIQKILIRIFNNFYKLIQYLIVFAVVKLGLLTVIPSHTSCEEGINVRLVPQQDLSVCPDDGDQTQVGLRTFRALTSQRQHTASKTTEKK